MASIKAHLPYKTTTFAFYKGTRVAPLPPKAVAAIIKDSATQCLKDFHTLGKTDAEIITILRGQLDHWEQQLCDHQERAGTAGEETTAEKWLSDAWGVQWKMTWVLWYINIATLLQLRALDDDDNNGFCIVQQKKK